MGCSGSNGSAPPSSATGVPAPAVSTGSTTSSPEIDLDTTPTAAPEVVLTTHPELRTRAEDAVGDGVRPEGFTTITARVTSEAGSICDVCLWLADDGDERARGLMGVTDLGGPVGMTFVWDAPIDGSFFMLGTPTPLSIAWFESGGSYLSETDMAPCITEDASTCERFGPGGLYDLAIEMFEGELDTVGIGPGSRVEILAGTEAPVCPLLS
jgi:uncharacterized protein